MTITLLDNKLTVKRDREEDGRVLFRCTVKEMNMADVSFSSQESNIASTDDSVKKEDSILNADQIKHEMGRRSYCCKRT